MSQRRRPLSLAILLAACGGASSSAPPAAVPEPTAEVAASPPPEPSLPSLCHFEGAIAGRLRTRGAGVPFGYIGAEGHADLVRADSGLRLDVEVANAGWHVGGTSDLDTDGCLYFAATAWLGDGVGAIAGGNVHVTDAREGEVLVGLHFGAMDYVSLDPPVERWLSCATDVRTTHPYVSEEDRNAALGLAEPRSILIVVQDPIPLSLVPDGPPFAELGATSLMEVGLLEESAPFRRVARNVASGVVVGWTRSSALRRGGSDDGRITALGALSAGPGPLGRCTSETRVRVLIETEQGREEIGWVDASTPFRRLGVRDDGAFLIEPATEGISPRSGVSWLGVSDTPLTCSAD